MKEVVYKKKKKTVIYIQKNKVIFNFGDVCESKYISQDYISIKLKGSDKSVIYTMYSFNKKFVTIEQWREQKINNILK